MTTSARHNVATILQHFVESPACKRQCPWYPRGGSGCSRGRGVIHLGLATVNQFVLTRFLTSWGQLGFVWVMMHSLTHYQHCTPCLGLSVCQLEKADFLCGDVIIVVECCVVQGGTLQQWRTIGHGFSEVTVRSARTPSAR